MSWRRGVLIGSLVGVVHSVTRGGYWWLVLLWVCFQAGLLLRGMRERMMAAGLGRSER